jgi:hypothetical protein
VKKEAKIAIGVAVLAVGAYLIYRWYQNRQQSQGSGQSAISQLGSNLNSMAPELVGGSSGPTSGPQVQMPVTITLTETGRGTKKSSSTLPIGTTVPPMNPLDITSPPSQSPDNDAESA